MIILKTKKQIEKMDSANKIVQSVLDEVGAMIKPGVNVLDLEKKARDVIYSANATPAFLGYYGFPACTCISINEAIVHGIPTDRELVDGDLVSVDCGVLLGGFAGDGARTFMVGDVGDRSKKLVEDTYAALIEGVNAMVDGGRLYDIASVISSIGDQNGYGNVRGYAGHGIGKSMHEPPAVFNYIESREYNIRFREGLVLALEPMFTLGSSDTKTLEDGWTVVSDDCSFAAHWEYSIAITDNGPKILGV